MSEKPKHATIPRCDATDGPCDRGNAPTGTECIICVLGRIREELSCIAEELGVLNENKEARQP
jgi:hypothetical protein